MSKKSKKRAAEKEAERLAWMKAQREKIEKERKARVRKTLIISAIAFALVFAITFGIIAAIIFAPEFSYIESDLSDYIYMDKKDYKDYELKLKFDTVDESDVDRKIMNLLYKNKASTPSYSGADMYTKPITVGDTAYLYYRGYTVDESGKKTYIDGASNFFSTDPYELGIGSLAFIPGFEEGLIGAIPEEHKLEIIKSGTVEEGDVLYLSFKVTYPDGSSASLTEERIDLSTDNIDEKYGKGFADYLRTLSVGVKVSEKTFPMEIGTAVYMDLSITALTRCEQNALVIDAHFPADYREESLRALDVKFDVFIDRINIYDVPEYNESFITDVLKITAEDLADYEGMGLVEKHRAKLMAEAVEENKKTRDAIIEDKMWNHYNEVVKVYELPEDEVAEVYNDRCLELQYIYQYQYSSYYSDFDSFARAYYGLNSNGNWKLNVKAEAEKQITEKLIFFYIIRKENLLPSAEEYEKTREEYLAEKIDEYIVSENLTAEIEKLEGDALTEKMAKIRADVIYSYGADFIDQMVYYTFSYEKLLAFANVVEQ